MEDNNIIVVIDDDTVILSSNSPDLNNLVEIVIKHYKDNYDFNKITIKCSNENFDIISFKDLLLGCINKFKTDLKVIDENKKTMNEYLDNKDKV